LHRAFLEKAAHAESLPGNTTPIPPHILIAPHGPGNLIAFKYRYKIPVCGGQMDDDIFPPQVPVEYVRVYKLPDSLL